MIWIAFACVHLLAGVTGVAYADHHRDDLTPGHAAKILLAWPLYVLLWMLAVITWALDAAADQVDALRGHQ